MPGTLTPTSQPGQAAAESSPVLAVVTVTAKPTQQARVLGELSAVTRRWAREAGCWHAVRSAAHSMTSRRPWSAGP